MKYIARNYDLTEVKDFMVNIKHQLNSSLVVEEVREQEELIGWRIVPLIKGRK